MKIEIGGGGLRDTPSPRLKNSKKRARAPSPPRNKNSIQNIDSIPSPQKMVSSYPCLLDQNSISSMKVIVIGNFVNNCV